jgi:hypothetical protein
MSTTDEVAMAMASSKILIDRDGGLVLLLRDTI